MEPNNVALPWYRSTIIISAVVSVLTKVLVISGLVKEIAPADVETISNTLVLVIGGIADLWAIKARVVQQEAPKIVSTQKVAAVHQAAAIVANDPLNNIPEASSVMNVQPTVFDGPNQGTSNNG